MSDPTFAMLTCAHGAEKAVKHSATAEGWRLAFSRPGFVTLKHDAQVDLPNGVFIRTAANSIGQVRGSLSRENIAAIAQTLTDSQQTPFDQMHVWPKDRAPIGRFGFEPGIDEIATAVADDIFANLKDGWLRCDSPNRVALPGERVLDVVLLEPSHWFVGSHVAGRWPSRWPGGVQPIEPKYEPISRAYFKAAEAIAWSGFEMRAGDRCVEIGSAPGGACGRLLELGMKVTGIDPAEMDPRIEKHQNFEHIRARAGDLPRKVYRGTKWILVDSNVKPEKTLHTVKNIVTHQHSTIRGLLMTLKIGDYAHANLIDQWHQSILQWNPAKIEARQLARNKCEICFAVTM